MLKLFVAKNFVKRTKQCEHSFFLTRGYARAYHELLQGQGYANESRRHAGIFQISMIQEPLTRPGVKLDEKMNICSSTPSTSTLA